MESGGSLPSASLTLAPMMVNTQDSPGTKSVDGIDVERDRATADRRRLRPLAEQVKEYGRRAEASPLR